MISIKKFKYLNKLTPKGYACQDCDTFGVRLYREYNSFMENQHLRCRECSIKNQKKEDVAFSDNEHSIGWLVAAVPTEDGESFWGFTSVPDDGVKWWEDLPKTI